MAAERRKTEKKSAAPSIARAVFEKCSRFCVGCALARNNPHARPELELPSRPEADRLRGCRALQLLGGKRATHKPRSNPAQNAYFASATTVRCGKGWKR